MDRGIAVNLAGRGLEDRHLEPLSEAQHVDRAVDRGLGRLHRIVLVVDRRGRAGEVEDRVDFHEQREAHVVAHELEPRVVREMIDVALVAGEQVVDAEHLVAAPEQAVDQMRAEKARAAGDQHPPPPKGPLCHAMTPH
jgi:hypothetical protein